MRKIVLVSVTLVGFIAIVFVFVSQKNGNIENQTISRISTSESSTEQSTTPTSETTSSTSTLKLEATEDLVSESYMVEREGINLYGVVTASRNYKNENRPLVIISHGFNNT